MIATIAIAIVMYLLASFYGMARLADTIAAKRLFRLASVIRRTRAVLAAEREATVAAVRRKRETEWEEIMVEHHVRQSRTGTDMSEFPERRE